MILNSKYIRVIIFFGVLSAFFSASSHSAEMLNQESTPSLAHHSSNKQSIDNKNKIVHVREGQARALKAIEEEKESSAYGVENMKSLRIKTTLLSDNKGREYIAGLINKADIAQYLSQLNDVLGEAFNEFRANQSARDHGLFHMTVVNPFEYELLKDHEALTGQSFTIQLHGLGRVIEGEHASYFVVASSGEGQLYRQRLLLNRKDFHITLGFKEHDIHSQAKNLETVITRK